MYPSAHYIHTLFFPDRLTVVLADRHIGRIGLSVPIGLKRKHVKKASSKLKMHRCGMGSRSSHISGSWGDNLAISRFKPMRLSNALTSTSLVLPRPFRHRVLADRSDSSEPGRPNLSSTRCPWLTAEREQMLVPQPTQPWHQVHRKEGGTHIHA